MSSTIDFGIDLGTTNSCVGRTEGSSIRIYQNNRLMNVTPSAVHILKSGRLNVGLPAYNAIASDPENVAAEFKRWMGQKDRVKFPASGKEMSAEELSAEILKSLKEDVRRQTGLEMTSAVITVPAAFGALQCEATARAATLAGFQEAPLLQEPIAAAIGYGTNPKDEAQRFLVFDLGGGTLDVAILSTKGGRLNVLEHRGDNILGGKDIDKAILEGAILPALRTQFDLPESSTSDVQLRGLMSRLRMEAESAKIELSTATEITLSLFDIGKDRSGKDIELEMVLSRATIDQLCEPIFEKCCRLTDEALVAARMSGGDLQRILLVGGPSQMPTLRQMLQNRLKSKIDLSVDPMTVVCKGAAIYASTIEKTGGVKGPGSRAPTDGIANEKPVGLKLVYEAVSSTLDCQVSGRIVRGPEDVQIKIESEGGIWTSGWITPTQGLFEIPVILTEGALSTFWVYSRDRQGSLLETDIGEFKIRHGLVPSSPPLPHPISIEVVNENGKPVLDPVFVKGTPLPAEVTVHYRSVRALSPNDPKSGLAIKLWEGEFLEAPEANEWVGPVVIEPSDVKRTVPAGSDIEVAIRISASRLITVDAFIPSLNLNFSGTVYVPQREEQDYSDLAKGVTKEIPALEKQLDQLEFAASGEGDANVAAELRSLRKDLDDLKQLESQALSGPNAETRIDPDNARRIVQESKKLGGKLSRTESRLSSSSGSVTLTKFVDQVESLEAIAGELGSNLEKQQFSLLKKQLERAAEKGDARSVERVVDEMDGLRWRILSKHDWFWRELFEAASTDAPSYVDPVRAKTLFELGNTAIANADGEALKKVVRELWELKPKSAADAAKASMILAGLRK